MSKKLWENPSISNLEVARTKESEVCPNATAKGLHFCEYYCAKGPIGVIFKGCGGCKKDGPCIANIIDKLPKCTCNNEGGGVTPPEFS